MGAMGSTVAYVRARKEEMKAFGASWLASSCRGWRR